MLRNLKRSSRFPHGFTIQRRCQHSKVSLQLDYYMSPQFAGVACAMTNGLYEKNGIDIDFLPICPVGLELQTVRDHHVSSVNDNCGVTVGSVEQNIFIPTLLANPDLDVNAIAAMFRKSPLCLASIQDPMLQNDPNELVIGAHEDTVSLLERIQPSSSVVASSRATKITDLVSGKYHSIQAYKTTEVPTLQRKLNTSSSSASILVQQLEGMNGAKLGYSQVLFAPKHDLIEKDKREMIQAFLDATFSGWELAIRDNEAAAKSVEEIKTFLGLDDEQNDHWDGSFDYTVQSTALCCDYVKETFQGDKYGVIDGKRFNEATAWLLQDEKGDNEKDFGFDPDIWQPSSQLLAGNELARTTLEDAAKEAEKFHQVYGRKPSLAVITVGELSRYKDEKRRLQIYSNDENSWFNKTVVGEANGFHVVEINLPKSCTEDELLSKVYHASKNFDGIQLMWPLPSHIDSKKMYNAIPLDCDADGAHYIGQLELASCHSNGNVDISPPPPVTPLAVINLLQNNNIDMRNKEVLVVGRSRIVGSPLAYMLRNHGSIVTIAHSEMSASKLEKLVKSAEIVISCAGSPGLLCKKWIQPDTTVINIGTTFSTDGDVLYSDFDDGDLSSVAKKYSPVPGGVGPLSVACLFQNAVFTAFKRMGHLVVEETWEKQSGCLKKAVHFKNYDDALAFANKVNLMSSDLDHHANMSFSHECVGGVNLKLELFTYEAGAVTAKDYIAAQKVDDIIESEKIKMDDFTYNLKINSIAKYPAEPRGSSRLLRVDADGIVSHFDNFSESFLSLVKDAHIVFNESKVANARISVSHNNYGSDIEMMILDLGDSVSKSCKGQLLTVMLRIEGVQCGDTFFDEKVGKGKFQVVEVVGPWVEDENSHGNGTECIVECLVQNDITLSELLDSVGTVPIPPYLNRKAEQKDESAYNNVYATDSGSVAAPTAGLHFTDSLLKNIGSKNISFLSLHVGAGTFKPVVTEDARDHAMHGESFSVSVFELRRIIQTIKNEKRIVVVGTTSSRTLESLYWCGVKLLEGKNKVKKESSRNKNVVMSLGQNEWSYLDKSGRSYSAVDALEALVDGKENDSVLHGRTSLMIVPGKYNFKVVDELVTNFHAPDSTLMLLVSSFLGSGEKVRTVYEEAQDKGYRFLSYGDVCFFSRSRK